MSGVVQSVMSQCGKFVFNALVDRCVQHTLRPKLKQKKRKI